MWWMAYESVASDGTCGWLGELMSSPGGGSKPINTIFRGMNIHLPAILMFTRGTRVLTHCHLTDQNWSPSKVSKVRESIPMDD